MDVTDKKKAVYHKIDQIFIGIQYLINNQVYFLYNKFTKTLKIQFVKFIILKTASIYE